MQKRIVGQLLDIINRPQLPPRWTPEHVSARLREAHRVLRRVPMSIGPQLAKKPWLHEHRAPGLTAAELSHCDEAIQWPMRYLSHKPKLARAVNQCAFDDVYGCIEGLALIAAGLTRDRVLVRYRSRHDQAQ
jgi:hypothetical protein